MIKIKCGGSSKESDGSSKNGGSISDNLFIDKIILWHIKILNKRLQLYIYSIKFW